MKKRIAILGSTGSIGTQALAVIQQQCERFEVTVLTAHSNADLLIRQALQYRPKAVVIGDEKEYRQVKEALSAYSIDVTTGATAVEQIVELDVIDTVLTAIVGSAGLAPTVRAIRAKKNIALANKETLVVAGALITQLVKEHNVALYPIDSEHSAIFQCLVGENPTTVEKILLTGSGGPFRGKTQSELATVTPQQALKHPTWEMGRKITIDSASLMNKGLEVIEARWLFEVDFNRIEVVIHPQSIIHSMVQFTDGSIKAQMGLPDMKLPIQYALTYPERLHTSFPRLTFDQYNQLTFEKPDTQTFRNLALAYHAGEKGGNCPCILNAANEIAVSAFLDNRIGFLQMSDLIEKCINTIAFNRNPSMEDLLATDLETRQFAIHYLKHFNTTSL
ncbi:1-deoxy-D-xylulose 5-phosphate reductoisomerase [Bacteroidia bacterium]|nr:1-deoxy-D-xylulose 5-phosphate reductoisomerase [Bacteroidia bacterium]